jgi:hypothetical protein
MNLIKFGNYLAHSFRGYWSNPLGAGKTRLKRIPAGFISADRCLHLAAGGFETASQSIGFTDGGIPAALAISGGANIGIFGI